ncbi:MAG TPA: sigma-70 family RNA polymerase sigma factor [Chryseosolibacter sp.]|nr:sigma-70 family RNA polymerase sigma factor [Chryseosolibacter sp.]
MANDPEYALIDRILAGETNLYSELVDRYKRYVFTIALKVVITRPEAEEAAQDVFIKAFQGLKRFNRQSKFSTWIYRIAFNTAISYKRKQRFQYQSIENSNIGGSEKHDESLEKTDRHKYLNAAMSRLTAADRIALTLFYLDELSLEEIAAVTGMQANTVKVRIHRARLRVATELKTILNEEALTL